MAMKLSKPESKPLILLLVKRTVLFLLAVCVLLLFVYAIGTAQDFLDSTQISVLRVISVVGLLLAVGSVYGFIIDTGFAAIAGSPRYILGSLSYLALALAGFGAAVFSIFLLATITGNVS